MRSRYPIEEKFVPYVTHLRRAGYFCTNNEKTDLNFQGDDAAIWHQCSGKAHYRNRAQGQPFFAVFNIERTHESNLFPEKIRSNKQQGHIPRKPRIDPKEVIVPPFVARKADLLFIHGSDEVMALLADGQAGRVTAWGANEHVVIGPADDPAGVRQASTGAEALQRIAAKQSLFVAFDDPGSHAIVQKLWRTSGARPPAGPWRLRDDASHAQGVITFAAARQAYVVAGHIPFAFGKMQGPGLAVLLQGDPAMRRPYVTVEQPGADAWACGPDTGTARRVAAYVASPAGQQAVRQAGPDARGTWIFALPPAPAAAQ